MCKSLPFLSIVFSLLFGVFISCDNDTNELGADIVGDGNFETGTPEFFDVNVQSVATGAVETLDLPVNALGIYENPVFGTNESNLAIQVQLNTINPTFDSALEPVLDSVILTIPYFSRRLSVGTDGQSTYELDSIYGPANGRIKLGVYESKYYIRDIDPQTQQIQRYYSDQDSEFDALKGVRLNDAADANQNDNFFFDPAEIVENGEVTPENQNPSKVRSAPAMRLVLNKDFFIDKIINAPPGKLLNNTVFKEYFRGLYLKVESSSANPGNLAMLNVKAGKITIRYSQKKSVTDANREKKSLVLNLNGKSVGFFKTGLAQPTIDERVYLKGGSGSMAVIDLFGSNPNTLAELRANKWLVNDASLTFFIDRDAMGTSAAEPNRIYLYDLKNKRPLVDYFGDQSSAGSQPKFAKSVFGGIIKKSGERGDYYKIKITNHIRGLINNIDSTNVKLGLVVTENIADTQNKKLKSPITAFGVADLPSASIVNPLGTILFGSGANVPIEKRIRLKIYFTKPKQN